MDNGFITLHRKILKHPLWKNVNTAVVFIHLLFQANFEESKFFYNGKQFNLRRGQLITGRKKLGLECGLDESTIYKTMKSLETMEVITIQSNNKFSLITVLKYNDYQLTPGYGNNKVTTKEQPSNSQVTQSNKVINKLNKLDTNVSRGKALSQVNPEVQLLWDYGTTKGFEERLQLKNRWAIKRLLGKLTVDQIKQLIDLSIEVRPRKFAPDINSFIDLDYKLLKLKSFVEREGSKQSRMA